MYGTSREWWGEAAPAAGGGAELHQGLDLGSDLLAVEHLEHCNLLRVGNPADLELALGNRLERACTVVRASPMVRCDLELVLKWATDHSSIAVRSAMFRVSCLLGSRAFSAMWAYEGQLWTGWARRRGLYRAVFCSDI